MALLVSAAAFLATTLVLLIVLGEKIVREPAVWLVAPLLYVCTFWVPNGMLAGLVDASEACMLALLACTLITRRWWLLPVVGVLGGLAKETFVPLSAVLAGTWWLVLCAEERRADWRGLAGIAAMALLAVAMPTLVRLRVDGQLVWPWVLAMQQKSHTTVGANFRRLVLDPGLYYPFVWIAPLAVWSWRRIPRPWLAGALASAGTAFALALFHNAGGTNVGRPMFNVLGVPMSLAAAMTLLELVRAPPFAGSGPMFRDVFPLTRDAVTRREAALAAPEDADPSCPRKRQDGLGALPSVRADRGVRAQTSRATPASRETKPQPLGREHRRRRAAASPSCILA